MKLVATKIPASTIKTIAKTPVITEVYASITIASAIMILMTLSIVPIFFFIVLLLFGKYLK